MKTSRAEYRFLSQQCESLLNGDAGCWLVVLVIVDLPAHGASYITPFRDLVRLLL